MTKEQEARILENQALIMGTLAFLTRHNPTGGGSHSAELLHRASDTRQFIKDYLK